MSLAVTSTSVWQRAEELRRAGRVTITGPTSADGVYDLDTTATGCRNHDQHRRHTSGSSPELHLLRAKNRPIDRGKAVGGGNDCCTVPGELTTRRGTSPSRVGNPTKTGDTVGSYSTGDLGVFSGTEFGSFDSVGRGYGDRSYSANEHPSQEEHDVCVASITSNSNKGPGQNSSTVPASPKFVPQMEGNIGRRRLHQSLATSRRRWFSKSCSQRLSWRKETEKRDRSPGRRPLTAPAASAAERKGSKGEKTLTPPRGLSRARVVCDQQELCEQMPTRVVTHDSGGGQRPNQRISSKFAQQDCIGAPGPRIVFHEGREEFERRGAGTKRETTAHQTLLDELETGRFRAETASARRKASQYQTCMQEAQVSCWTPLFAVFLGARQTYCSSRVFGG